MPVNDDFTNHAPALDDPYESAVPIATSDANNFSNITRGIYVGGAGNIALVMKSGQVVTLIGVPVGTFLRVRATRVNSTNTTATNLVAFW